MNTATFTIHPALKEFLAEESVSRSFWGEPAVKDLIESLGIPHVEIGSIEVNHSIVPLQNHIKDNDEILIWPVIWRPQFSDKQDLRPKMPGNIRFILDVHLGKLARMMRLFGFDTIYETSLDDPEIINLGIQQKRFILTRDKKLLMRSDISYGHWIRNTDPIDQMDEILLNFDLYDQINPFSRCLNCNGHLQSVEKKKIEDKLPPRVRKYYQYFQQCTSCHKIFWRGSHYERMSKRLSKNYGLEVQDKNVTCRKLSK